MSMNYKLILFLFRAKVFTQYFKKILKDCEKSQQLILLDLLDYLVVECKIPLHTQIASKDFISFLIGLLKAKDTPEVQVKILCLIKKWGVRFESQKDILPNFYETYKTLKSNGVIFPEKSEYIELY